MYTYVWAIFFALYFTDLHALRDEEDMQVGSLETEFAQQWQQAEEPSKKRKRMLSLGRFMTKGYVDVSYPQVGTIKGKAMRNAIKAYFSQAGPIVIGHSKEVCSDKDKLCGAWKKKGFCVAKYKVMMGTTCPVTCGFCKKEENFVGAQHGTTKACTNGQGKMTFVGYGSCGDDEEGNANRITAKWVAGSEHDALFKCCAQDKCGGAKVDVQGRGKFLTLKALPIPQNKEKNQMCWQKSFPACAKTQNTGPDEKDRYYSSVFNEDKKGTGHASSALESATGWTPKISKAGQYLMMDLGKVEHIKGVVVQARGKKRHWVETFKVSYRNDDIKDLKQEETKCGKCGDNDFIPVDGGKAFEGPKEKGDEQIEAPFDHMISARYVLIKPVTWKHMISMRAGVMKCEVQERYDRTCWQKGKDIASRDALCAGDLVCARNGYDGRLFGDCPYEHCCSVKPDAEQEKKDAGPKCCLCTDDGKISWSKSGTCSHCQPDQKKTLSPKDSTCKKTRGSHDKVSKHCKKSCKKSNETNNEKWKYCHHACTCNEHCEGMFTNSDEDGDNPNHKSMCCLCEGGRRAWSEDGTCEICKNQETPLKVLEKEKPTEKACRDPDGKTKVEPECKEECKDEEYCHRCNCLQKCRAQLPQDGNKNTAKVEGDELGPGPKCCLCDDGNISWSPSGECNVCEKAEAKTKKRKEPLATECMQDKKKPKSVSKKIKKKCKKQDDLLCALKMKCGQHCSKVLKEDIESGDDKGGKADGEDKELKWTFHGDTTGRCCLCANRNAVWSQTGSCGSCATKKGGVTKDDIQRKKKPQINQCRYAEGDIDPAEVSQPCKEKCEKDKDAGPNCMHACTCDEKCGAAFQ